MRIERGGVALELPQSNKTMALLAYLLWSPRPHRRTQLAAMLWCDADDPRGGLRWSLSKLRSLLDDDQRTRVSADREEVSIDASYLDVDVLAVRTAARAPRHGALEVLISVADGMKDGDLLDDIDWQTVQTFTRGSSRRARRCARGWWRSSRSSSDALRATLPSERRITLAGGSTSNARTTARMPRWSARWPRVAESER
jgi:hypothetical protein